MIGRALALACLLAPLACGSGSASGTGGAGGANDGKVHPPADGKAEVEADACGALVGAIQAKFQALSCVGTTRQCPEFLSAQFGACFEYDAGTVKGCADYYAKQTTCDALQTAIDDCVVETISGSSGKGCP